MFLLLESKNHVTVREAIGGDTLFYYTDNRRYSKYLSLYILSMEVISLKSFLKLFHVKNEKQCTVKHLMTNAHVQIGTKLRKLREYKEDKQISNDTIKILCENINNRDEYLTRFYNLSLQIHPDKLSISDTGINPMRNREMNNNQQIVFKNIIRNLHMFDILQHTKSGIENVPTFFDMLYDLYLHDIIDYKLLTPSATHYIKHGRIGSVFSSYYFRASIMNPYLVYSLNQTVFQAKRVFSPTLGWSSYCYGFLESPYTSEYVGTDVIPSVCEKTKEIADIYLHQKNIDIYCKPSEDLHKDKRFMSKYREHFDLVFFSPPYYELELYNSKDQSTDRYKTYEEWLREYWEETIKLCHHVLEKSGKLCYILSGYGSQTGSTHVNLLKDMNSITKKYFGIPTTQPMYNKNVHVTSHRETGEQIMIFTKR
jgi:hypothetical protein